MQGNVGPRLYEYPSLAYKWEKFPYLQYNWIIDQKEAPLSLQRCILCTHAHLPQHIYPTAGELLAAETIDVDFIRPFEGRTTRGTPDISMFQHPSPSAEAAGTTNYECFMAAFHRDPAEFTDIKVDGAVKKEIDLCIG